MILMPVKTPLTNSLSPQCWQTIYSPIGIEIRLCGTARLDHVENCIVRAQYWKFGITSFNRWSLVLLPKNISRCAASILAFWYLSNRGFCQVAKFLPVLGGTAAGTCSMFAVGPWRTNCALGSGVSTAVANFHAMVPVVAVPSTVTY